MHFITNVYQEGGDLGQIPDHFDDFMGRNILFKVNGIANSDDGGFGTNESVVVLDDEKTFTLKTFTEDVDILAQYNNLVSVSFTIYTHNIVKECI